MKAYYKQTKVSWEILSGLTMKEQKKDNKVMKMKIKIKSSVIGH